MANGSIKLLLNNLHATYHGVVIPNQIMDTEEAF